MKPIITLTNYGTSPITTASIEWRMNDDALHYIDFTGNLAQYESVEYLIGPLYPPLGNNEFHAVLTSINGEGDENTDNNFFTDGLNTIELESYDTMQIHLEIQTDDYAQETSWEFLDSDGSILYSHGPYEDEEDNMIFNYTFDVEYDQCYSFIIYDDYGDGICCGFGEGYYTLTTDDDTIIVTGGEFEFEEIIDNISVDEPLYISENILENISIYPNPANEVLHINVGSGSSDYKYQIINVFGQVITNGVIKSGLNTLLTSQLANGLYFISLIDSKINQANIIKIIIE